MFAAARAEEEAREEARDAKQESKRCLGAREV